MKIRCTDENSSSYKNYGGRGIKVCEEWENPKVFYDWAMANGYAEGLQIDRIDNNGNYEPNNCRWTTRKEQARNRRTNHKVEINGESRLLIEWAESVGICINTINARYLRGDRGEKLIRPLGKRE